MEFIQPKNLKMFMYEGEYADESDVIRLKAQYEKLLISYMRSKGYLRQIDLDPVYTVNYNGKTFKFELFMYGIYVGKRRSQCYQFVMGTRLIPMNNLPQSKLSQCCKNAESVLGRN